jgi:rubrerythrin
MTLPSTNSRSPELTTLLADVKLALTDARTEHSAKDAEIERLKAFLAKRDADTVEHHGYRYRKGEDGNPKGEPYCPVCEAKHGLLFLTTTTENFAQQCPNCKAVFGGLMVFNPK